MFLRLGNRGFLFVFSAALLFALSFPSPLVFRGLPLVAYGAQVPLFLLLWQPGRRETFYQGFLYGFFSYGLLTLWLLDFDPLLWFLLLLLMGLHFFLLAPLLAWGNRLFPQWGYLLALPLWLAYEVLRTKGFWAFPYGLLGYSQAFGPPVISIADWGGVFVVSALVLFPSLWLAKFLLIPPGERAFWGRPSLWIPGGIYLLFLGAALIYGAWSEIDYSSSPRWRVALIQHNYNTWLRSEEEESQKALDILLDLSEEVFSEKPALLVWPEGAFAPPLGGLDRNVPSLQAQTLLGQLASWETPLLMGNNDVSQGNTYNAALLLERGEVQGRYHKRRLVPFTEHLPYRVPLLGSYLEKRGMGGYSPGRIRGFLSVQGVDFGISICYEDSFGPPNTEAIRQGAEVLVNLTNDSWTRWQSASQQHLGMAVFRGVENRRTLLRASTGGMTVLVDPNGRVLDSLPAYQTGSLVVEAPLYREKETFYTKAPFLFEVILVTLGGMALLFLAGAEWVYGRKRHDRKWRDLKVF